MITWFEAVSRVEKCLATRHWESDLHYGDGLEKAKNYFY